MPDLACAAFVTTDEVLEASCACTMNETDHGDLIVDYIADASDMLYVFSGGRVTGRCERQSWPVKIDPCLPWYAQGYERADWVTYDSVDSIVLPGPDTEIVEVTIDGVMLSPSEYRLLDGNKLFRREGSWPTSNDLTLDDSEVGTFTITHRFGRTPNSISKRAAIAMVCQMVEGDAVLNRMAGVIAANVQGVSVQYDPDEIRSLGLAAVNRFLDTYAPRGVAPLGMYSPEIEHGWRLHTVTGGSGS